MYGRFLATLHVVLIWIFCHASEAKLCVLESSVELQVIKFVRCFWDLVGLHRYACEMFFSYSLGCGFVNCWEIVLWVEGWQVLSVWECLILPYEKDLEGKPGFCLEWVNFYYSRDVVLLHVSQFQKEQLELCCLLREIKCSWSQDIGTFEAQAACLLLSRRAIALYSAFLLK